MVSSMRLDPVLVTGASGFVGNCVVRRLLSEGPSVHVLLRPSAKMWRLKDVRDRLNIHWIDVLEAEAVRAAVMEVKPAAILHLAAFGAYESQSAARQILQTNILGSYNLLEAAIEAGTGVFISTGSSSEYGYSSEPMRETARVEPNSTYAVAKAAQTHLCSLIGRTSETRVVTFRLFSVYGPWEEPTRLVPNVIRRARAGLPLQMVSPATARDFVYVDEVVDALLNFAALDGTRGEVFNLGTGVQSTLVDFVAAVQEVVGDQSEVRWGGMEARKWDTSSWVADPSKTDKMLGWKARVSLREGVRRMAAWMQEVGDDYGRG